MADNIPSGGLPNEQERPLPTPFDDNRASPEEYGAGAGQGAQQVAALASALGERALYNANRAAENELKAAGDNALSQQIISDKTGFRALHGHDALKASGRALGDFDKTLAQIGTRAVTEDQKAAWAGYSRGLRREADNHIQSHAAQEGQKVEGEAYKNAQTALVGQLGSFAVASDPKRRASTMWRITRNAIDRAHVVMGESATPEDVAAFTIQARSLAVRQSLETLLANEATPGALDEAHRIINDPDNQTLLGRADTALIEGRINRRAYALGGLMKASAAAANARRRTGGMLIDQEAFDEVQNWDGPPEAKKAAEEELSRRATAGRHLQEQTNKAAFANAIVAIDKRDWPTVQASIDKLSAGSAKALDGGDLIERILNFKHARATQDANSPEMKKAQGLALNSAHSLLGMVRASDYTDANDFLSRAGPGGTDMTPNLSGLGIGAIGQEFEKKKQKEENDKALGAGVEKQIIASMVEPLSYPASAKTEPTADQKAERQIIQEYVREQRNKWEAANPNKIPGDAEYQRWIDEKIAKVPGSSPWYKPDRYRVEMDVESRRAADAEPPPQPYAPASATPAAPPAVPPVPTHYRYTPDRKKRVPTDAQGKSIGPVEENSGGFP